MSEEIFEWLSSLNLLSNSEGKLVSDNKYSLGKQVSSSLENGQLFAKIIRKLGKI